MKAIQFKILQRRLKFRNPNHLLDIPESFSFGRDDHLAASSYLDDLVRKEIRFTHPGHADYPAAFTRMKEPPLFFEFQGPPVWRGTPLVSVIGSREISSLSSKWMKLHLPEFIEQAGVGVVSGGARGVDQLAHLLCLKIGKPSIFVLPSGLDQLYPANLEFFRTAQFSNQCCFLSEFESPQKIHKSHFYFRNRLIAALGEFTFVVQASLKSGSLLTVHHCLENGRPVAVIPSHPEILGFEGNLKLLQDGAYSVSQKQDLLDFWFAEFQTKSDLVKGD